VQTFIGTPTTVVTLEYHAAHFNFDRLDLIGLRDDFQFLGNVRTRSIEVTAAGSDTLTLIIEFIGVSAASGIIGYLQGKLFDRIIKAIGKAKKYSDPTYGQEFTGVRLVYEDTEIIINGVAELDEEHICDDRVGRRPVHERRFLLARRGRRVDA